MSQALKPISSKTSSAPVSKPPPETKRVFRIPAAHQRPALQTGPNVTTHFIDMATAQTPTIVNNATETPDPTIIQRSQVEPNPTLDPSSYHDIDNAANVGTYTEEGSQDQSVDEDEIKRMEEEYARKRLEQNAKVHNTNSSAQSGYNPNRRKYKNVRDMPYNPFQMVDAELGDINQMEDCGGKYDLICAPTEKNPQYFGKKYWKCTKKFCGTFHGWAEADDTYDGILKRYPTAHQTVNPILLNRIAEWNRLVMDQSSKPRKAN